MPAAAAAVNHAYPRSGLAVAGSRAVAGAGNAGSRAARTPARAGGASSGLGGARGRRSGREPGAADRGREPVAAGRAPAARRPLSGAAVEGRASGRPLARPWPAPSAEGSPYFRAGQMVQCCTISLNARKPPRTQPPGRFPPARPAWDRQRSGGIADDNGTPGAAVTRPPHGCRCHSRRRPRFLLRCAVPPPPHRLTTPTPNTTTPAASTAAPT